MKKCQLFSGRGTETVLNELWDIEGTQNNSIDHEKEVILSLQKDKEEDLSLVKGFYLMLMKQSLESRYSNFLYSTEELLGNNLGSEELALTLIKSRQSRVGELINSAFGICSECNVQYNELYMAYVLEQLYSFLGQQPEFVKIGYELKIKNSESIRQLLRKATRLDVFALSSI